MAERSWLFDVANAPKGGQNQAGEYEFSKLMGAMSSNGIMTVNNVFNLRTVVGSNELSVFWASGNGNFVTQVRIGEAMVAGSFYENTTALNLTHSAPSPTSGQDRIDRIVLQLDWSQNTINAVILQGATGTTPAAPALTQQWGVKWEVPLAQVRVKGASTSLSDLDITDERVPYLPAGLTPSVRMTRSALALTNIIVDLDYDTVQYETMQGMYVTSGVGTKFIAPFPGLYQINGTVHFGSGGVAGTLTTRLFRAQKYTAAGVAVSAANGGYVFYDQREATNNSSNFYLSGSGIINLDKGEYILLAGGHSFTSQITIDTLSVTFTYMGRSTVAF
jgi:hypothetical protein